MIDVEIARASAKAVGLLNERGELKKIDSLALLDLLGELETRAEVSIPTEALTLENFASLESVAALLGILRSRT